MVATAVTMRIVELNASLRATTVIAAGVTRHAARLPRAHVFSARR